MKANKSNKIKKNQDINYISVPETLEKPWSKPYNETKWLTCKANFSNLSKIFLAYQSYANFLYLINVFFSAYCLVLTIFLFKKNHFYVLTNLLYSFVSMCSVIRKIFSTNYNYEFYHVVSCYLEDIEDGISKFNPIKPGGGEGRGYFWTACGMNLKLYDFSLPGVLSKNRSSDM